MGAAAADSALAVHRTQPGALPVRRRHRGRPDAGDQRDGLFRHPVYGPGGIRTGLAAVAAPAAPPGKPGAAGRRRRLFRPAGHAHPAPGHGRHLRSPGAAGLDPGGARQRGHRRNGRPGVGGALRCPAGVDGSGVVSRRGRGATGGRWPGAGLVALADARLRAAGHGRGHNGVGYRRRDHHNAPLFRFRAAGRTGRRRSGGGRRSGSVGQSGRGGAAAGHRPGRAAGGESVLATNGAGRGRFRAAGGAVADGLLGGLRVRRRHYSGRGGGRH